MLRETFAARLARAFSEVDYEAVFADPEQMALFGMEVETIRPVLTVVTLPSGGPFTDAANVSLL